MLYRKRLFRCAAPIYHPGTVRYRRVICCEDVRAYPVAKGWSAMADELEYHPITGEPFLDRKGKPYSEWWITETKDEEDEDEDDE